MPEEQTNTNRQNIVEELNNYRHHSTLWTVNRDGDWYYIECPECHHTDLTQTRVFGCKSCHTRFTVCPEDGIDWHSVLNEMSSPHGGDKKIKLIKETPSDYFPKIWYGRNEGREVELTEQWPNAKLITLSRDFNPKTGKDAHGHQEYEKFILIPV